MKKKDKKRRQKAKRKSDKMLVKLQAHWAQQAAEKKAQQEQFRQNCYKALEWLLR